MNITQKIATLNVLINGFSHSTIGDIETIVDMLHDDDDFPIKNECYTAIRENCYRRLLVFRENFIEDYNPIEYKCEAINAIGKGILAFQITYQDSNIGEKDFKYKDVAIKKRNSPDIINDYINSNIINLYLRGTTTEKDNAIIIKTFNTLEEAVKMKADIDEAMSAYIEHFKKC